MKSGTERWLPATLLLVAMPLLLASCGGDDRPTVVIYASIDRHFAEPVLKARLNEAAKNDVAAKV